MIYITLLICAGIALLFGSYNLIAHKLIKNDITAEQKKIMVLSFVCAAVCLGLWFVHKQALVVIFSVVLGFIVGFTCYALFVHKRQKANLRPLFVIDIVAVVLLAFTIISNDEWNIYRPNKDGEPYRLTIFGRYSYQQKMWNSIKADKMARSMEARRLNARNRLQTDADAVTGTWYCKNVLGLPYRIEFYNGKDVLLVIGSKYNSLYNGGTYQAYGNEIRVRMNGTNADGSEGMFFTLVSDCLIWDLKGTKFYFERVE